MSAFIVSKEHIDAMVTELTLSQFGRVTGGTELSKHGQQLWEENHKSVNYRYGENAPCPTYKFATKRMTPVEVLKLVACYQYQTCEHDGHEQSDAWQLSNEIKELAIRRLPGYEDAPWGL